MKSHSFTGLAELLSKKEKMKINKIQNECKINDTDVDISKLSNCPNGKTKIILIPYKITYMDELIEISPEVMEELCVRKRKSNVNNNKIIKINHFNVEKLIKIVEDVRNKRSSIKDIRAFYTIWMSYKEKIYYLTYENVEATFFENEECVIKSYWDWRLNEINEINENNNLDKIEMNGIKMELQQTCKLCKEMKENMCEYKKLQKIKIFMMGTFRERNRNRSCVNVLPSDILGMIINYVKNV
jgi:hypothetical protein